MSSPPTGLAELASRAQIADLVAAYARAGDAGRIDAFVSCFAPDGVLEVKGRINRGHAEIAGFVGEIATRFAGDRAFLPARHHVASIWCELGGDGEATGGAYFSLVAATGLDHWGVYRDRYVCIDQRWYFAHRRVRLEGARDGSPVLDQRE